VSSSTPNWLWRLDAQHRFFFSGSVAAIAFWIMPHNSHLLTRLLVAWNSGIICLLISVWSVIVTAHPKQIKKRSQTQDFSRIVIAILVVTAAIASLFAVIFVLGTSKDLPLKLKGLHIALSVVSVVGSWLLVHTMFTLRYAHYYYLREQSHSQEEHAGGLDFPGQNLPDYWDFAYFSFVLGMTFQVSDVVITSRLIRRLALLHSLLSFAFNTIIVALSINIISSLL
jgi:uncharacterized membrane protein